MSSAILILNEHHSISTLNLSSIIPFNPCGICSNSKGEILITSPLSNQVQILSQNGLSLRKLKLWKEGAGFKSTPMGICVDSEDNIFVADRGRDKVLIFTPEGKLIQKLSVLCPHDLCLLENQLIVVGWDNYISIFSN